MPGTEFVVMTYNVGNGLASASRLTRYLQVESADVIGLQEVSSVQAGVIELELAELYPYRIVSGSGFAGRALLSRFPIASHTWIPSEPDRPDLQAQIEIEGREIAVVVAHPPPARPGREGLGFNQLKLAQIRATADMALKKRPAVLLGDFNMTIRNPAYRWMTGLGLNDAYVNAGPGAGRTFPVRLCLSRRSDTRITWMPLRPIARLDYIWHTAEFTTSRAWLGEDAGSDHLPVLARLLLGDKQ